jgi:hypothetical protein
MKQPYSNLSKNVVTSSDGTGLTTEQIAASALIRIAVATELMAKNYVQMQNDLDYYKKGYRERQETINQRDNTIRTLRGHITRLKNKK